jgi:biopolymer transport protein TolQ
MQLLLAASDVNALKFSAQQVSKEGAVTMSMLAIVSLLSWSVIINKAIQLRRARRSSAKFFAAWRENEDPMAIARSGKEFAGCPAYEVYRAAAEEMDFHLSNHPLKVRGEIRVSVGAFELVKAALERTAGAEAIGLEKGMIVLSTAVAGGPFIGLLGTVFGVMETFAGIAVKQAASITAMAPGVAGALLNTVIGLFVAIPAMFAYNFQVTTIRGLTHELDNFVSEVATAMEHKFVDNRSLSEEIRDAIRVERETGVFVRNPNAPGEVVQRP